MIHHTHFVIEFEEQKSQSNKIGKDANQEQSVKVQIANATDEEEGNWKLLPQTSMEV